jgi:hypothetical protein
MAEEAYTRASRSPAIADTLGWLLYQKGDIDRAEWLLAQAAKRGAKPQIRFETSSDRSDPWPVVGRVRLWECFPVDPRIW